MAEQGPQRTTERSQPSRAAAPARGSHEAPAAGGTLDEKGKTLLGLLPQVLAPYGAQLTMALDEVVVTLEPGYLLEACQTLKDDPRLALDYLRCLSVVDYKDHLQVVCHVASVRHRHKLVVKVNVPVEAPMLPSLTPVWRATDWFEREGSELYGVEFQGHPNPKPLLLWEGFKGCPGRKSFPFHDYQEF